MIIKLDKTKPAMGFPFDQLGSLTFFIGQNGAGKTELLDAIHYAHGIEKPICLDPIDAGLHSRTVWGLLRYLRCRPKSFPPILATTYNPCTIETGGNFYGPINAMNVWCVARDRHDIYTGQLSDHPEFETWQEEMSPGEMWSLFGEEWIIEEWKKTTHIPQRKRKE